MVTAMALGLATHSYIYAQPERFLGKKIKKIEFKGNVNISRDTLYQDIIQMKEGQTLTLPLLNGDIKAIFGEGSFAYARVEGEDLDGGVKLIDFGVAHLLDGNTRWYRPQVANPKILTPELVTAGYTTAQSDLYQLGLLLYQMHTGQPAMDVNAPYPEITRQIAEGGPRQKARRALAAANPRASLCRRHSQS